MESTKQQEGTRMHTYSSYTCWQYNIVDICIVALTHTPRTNGEGKFNIWQQHGTYCRNTERNTQKNKTQLGTAHSTHLSTQSAIIAQCIVINVNIRILKSVGCCHIHIDRQQNGDSSVTLSFTTPSKLSENHISRGKQEKVFRLKILLHYIPED